MRGVRAGTRVRRIDTRTLRRRRRGETCFMLTLYLPGFALLPPGHAASALGLSGREVVRLFLWFLPPLLLLLRSQLRRGAPSSDRRNPHDPRALSQLSCATTALQATCSWVPTCDRGSSSQLQISASASPLAFLQTLLRYRARLRCVRWHVTQRHAVNVCPVEARADKSVSCGGQRRGCCFLCQVFLRLVRPLVCPHRV